MVEHEHKDWHDHLEDAGWSYADAPVGESRSNGESKTIVESFLVRGERRRDEQFRSQPTSKLTEQNLTDLLRVLRFRSVPRGRASLTTLQEPG